MTPQVQVIDADSNREHRHMLRVFSKLWDYLIPIAQTWEV